MNPSTIIISTGITQAASSFLSPITARIEGASVAYSLDAQMDAWFRDPVVPPPPVMILDAANKGFVTEGMANLVCRNQGVNLYAFRERNRDRNHRESWKAVRDAMLLRPSVEWVMNQWGRGYWDVNSDAAAELLKQAGADVPTWTQYVSAFFDTPPMATLMEGRLRGLISEEQLTEGMKRHGYGNAIHRDLYRGLMQVNPPPSDWIHFAVKEALSPDIANVVRLYDEVPHQIDKYMGWHGLNWKLDFTITSDGERRRATVFDLYWASHWQPISPTQAYTAFHLFRANRLERYAQAGVPVTEFTLQDVERWLRINDYPPGVRNHLLAMSFTPLRLVDIRQAIAFNYRANNDLAFRAALPADLQQRFDSYNRQWAIEQFRDRGVLPSDAETQVDLVIASVVWQQQGPIRNIKRSLVRRTMNAILAGVDIGIVPDENAMAGLRELGLDEETARGHLDIVSVTDQMQTARAVIAAARRGYLSGSLTETTVTDALTGGGVQEAAAFELVQRWRMEFNADRIQATTAKVIQWLAEGRMTPEQGRVRLANLGWLDPDTTMLLAEAQGRALRLQGQAIRAADVARRKRAGELEKALKQAQRNVEVIQQAIRRQTPITTLQRFVKKGLITQRQFLTRAVRAGYPQPVAERYLADALSPNPRSSESAQQTSNQPQTPANQQSPESMRPGEGPEELTASQPPVEPERQVVNVTPPQVLNTPPAVLNTPPREFGGDER